MIRSLGKTVLVLIAIGLVGTAWEQPRSFANHAGPENHADPDIIFDSTSLFRIRAPYIDIGNVNINGGITASGKMGFGTSSAVTQGVSWKPDLLLSSNVGSAFAGPISFINNGVGPSLDLTYCTGLNNSGGFQDGCDIQVYSSDADGELYLTGGPSGTSMTGTVQLVFTQIWPSIPYCQLTLADESGSWNDGATVRLVTPSGGRTRQTAFKVKWNNNGVPFPAGGGAGIQYFCVASP